MAGFPLLKTPPDILCPGHDKIRRRSANLPAGPSGFLEEHDDSIGETRLKGMDPEAK